MIPIRGLTNLVGNDSPARTVDVPIARLTIVERSNMPTLVTKLESGENKAEGHRLFIVFRHLHATRVFVVSTTKQAAPVSPVSPVPANPLRI